MTQRKILHAADIHLDSPLLRLEAYEGAPVDQIRLASRRAFQNLTQLAKDQNVDLVVVAGDLYDGNWTDQNTGLFFVREASELIRAGIKVVIIRGNHDAANLMTQSLRLPRNPDGSEIMLDHRQVDRRVFEDLGLAIHGRSFPERAVKFDMSKDYPAPIAGLFNLGLLHTCLAGADGHDPYSPCSPSELASKGYDYWALGHVHAHRDFAAPGEPPIVFPGNIQGRHIREVGAKGCVVLEIDSSNRVTHRFHPLDVVRWEVMEFDAKAADGSDREPESLLDAFTPWLHQSLARCEHRPLAVRIRVSGRTEHHSWWNRLGRSLENDLRSIAIHVGGGQVWIESVRICTQREIQSESTVRWSDDEGPLGALHHVLRRMKNDPAAMDRLRESLTPLAKKLPAELTTQGDLDVTTRDATCVDGLDAEGVVGDGPVGDGHDFRSDEDDQPISLLDPRRWSVWIEQAEPLLLQRLETAENES